MKMVLFDLGDTLESDDATGGAVVMSTETSGSRAQQTGARP